MSAPAGGDKKNIVKMAYIYFQEGRWDKAVEEYKKLLALDPDDINTHNMLGDVYVKKGAPREAFEEYIKVSTDFSSRGATDKAVIVNKKIAALDTSLLPPDAQKKQSLIKQTIKAEMAMEQGNVDEAIEALSEVSKIDSENLSAYAKLAELFEKKGNIPQAVQQYVVLGTVFLKNRLYKKALEMYQRVVQLDPNHMEARINLAQIFIKQGSESDAKREFLVIAELALSTGDMENAATYGAKAVEFKSIEAHYILGMVMFKKQQLSEAKAEFESLLRFKVNHVGALSNLGRVLLEMNQPDKAAENIQKALKLEKDNLTALEAWVEVCLKKGNKAEATTTLNTLVDRYVTQGNLEKATEFARDLISLDENLAPPHAKLADILKQSGNKNGAADSFFKAALAYEKQNKNELSMDFVRKVLELNPGHTEAQKRMMGGVVAGATAVPSQATPPKAVESIGKIPATGVLDLEENIPAPKVEAQHIPVVEKAKPKPVEVESPDEVKAQIAIADDYVKQGLVQEAIEIYQELMEAHPGNPELKQKLNQAYTAYVKTGDDVIGALEAEKKVKEEEEKNLRREMERKADEEARRLRAEMEQKARQEAEKQVRSELEKKAREEADTRAKEEMEKMAREAALKRAREEAERLSREEVERRGREDSARRSREESERKIRDEGQRKIASLGGELKTSRTDPPSKGDALSEDRDEFMTIAVADIYTRQGLYEEASKIYHRILQMEPDNLEARKKLNDLEPLMRLKAGKSASDEKVPTLPSKPTDAPPSATPPPSGPEKDSGGKKKSNRVGYV